MSWQPIETAPKDGTEILVWAVDPYKPKKGRKPYAGAHVTAWSDYRRRWEMPHELKGACPSCNRTGLQENHWDKTHWMPLPLAPKEEV